MTNKVKFGEIHLWEQPLQPIRRPDKAIISAWMNGLEPIGPVWRAEYFDDGQSRPGRNPQDRRIIHDQRQTCLHDTKIYDRLPDLPLKRICERHGDVLAERPTAPDKGDVGSVHRAFWPAKRHSRCPVGAQIIV